MTTTAPPATAPTISPDVPTGMTTFARIGLAATCEGLSLVQAHELGKILTVLRTRGAVELPPLPQAQRLIWQDGAPRRVRAKATKSDEIAADLAVKMQPFVKADMGAEAQALLETTPGLTVEAQTEWQAKVAWMYFLTGDDVNTRAMAAKGVPGTMTSARPG